MTNGLRTLTLPCRCLFNAALLMGALFSSDVSSTASPEEAFRWALDRGETHERFSGQGAPVTIEGEPWESPRVDVEPLAYYRVVFRARGGDGALSGVIFENGGGQALTADAYDGIRADEGNEWVEQRVVVRTGYDAARLFLRIHPVARAFEIDQLVVERVTPEEARIEIDQLASKVPVIPFTSPSDRAAQLPRTSAILREGGKLRIVMLGDSICNDTSQSLFELLLMNGRTDLEIEVITSVRSATGARWYRRSNRVEAYVLRHNPDLLIIAGISHGFDTEAIRSVIRQVREQSDAEILVLNGAITPPESLMDRMLASPGMTDSRREENEERMRRRISALIRQAETFNHRLRQMCREEEVAFFDIRHAWDQALLRSGLSVDLFLRDSIHANRLGKQWAGRLLYLYLLPNLEAGQ